MNCKQVAKVQLALIYLIGFISFTIKGTPKFLTLPFVDAEVNLAIQQGWYYRCGNWNGDLHRGVDFIKGEIDLLPWESFDVVASADGVAMWSEQYYPDGTGYGKFVLIRHNETDEFGNHYFTLYGHLSEVAPGIPYKDRYNTDYSSWKPVYRGEYIGRAGATGVSNPDWIHLHFEVFRGGYNQNSTDPYDIYQFREFYPGWPNYIECGSNYLWISDPPVPPVEIYVEKLSINVMDKFPWFIKGQIGQSDNGYWNCTTQWWRYYTYEGITYLYTWSNGSETNYWAGFRPFLAHSGVYEVYTEFFADPENSSHVPYIIYHKNGRDVVYVDQYSDQYFDRRTVYLGTYEFESGLNAYVMITDATGDSPGSKTIKIDTVYFVYKYPSIEPDLTVEDIWLEPANFAPGDTVEIYTRIANIGDADAGGFAIKVYFDGALIVTDGAEGLGAGASTTLPSPWSYTWPADTNTHTIRVVVDANNDVAESNEGNNERSESFSATAQATVTIDSVPRGMLIHVDGYLQITPYSYTCTSGSSTTVNAISPQSPAEGERYVFVQWQDGSTENPRTIMCPATDLTYTIVFQKQYRLITSANPSNGGTVSPSGETWHDDGASVQVQAFPNAGWQFIGWSGDLSGTQNPATIIMNAPKTVTANFNRPPNVPSNPSPVDGATGVGIDTDLSWTGGDPDGDPTTYDLYFGTSSPPPLRQTSLSSTYYDPGTMEFNTTYYWQIVAKDDKGGITEGPIWRFTTTCMVPPPPTGVSATDGISSAHVMVTWNEVPEAQQYEVWRAEALGGPYDLRLAITSDTVYYDTLAAWTPGKVFWYKVKACNDCGCGEFSEADSGYAGTPVPGTSATFRVERETGNVFTDGTFYGHSFETGSADIAEWVPVSELVEPGDVLEIDPEHPGYYRKARGPCSALVAGVVSTEPGFVLSHSLDLEDKALLALIGIVPVKVTDEGGPIRPGDLLVVSSTPGYAMRWDPESGELCDFVGKALEPLERGTGLILVLLMG